MAASDDAAPADALARWHMTDDDPNVSLTATAQSKAFRLCSGRLLRQRVRNLAGRLWQKGDSNEFHLAQDDAVIVFVVEDDGASVVVVTQMHPHPDYQQESIYRKVSRH